ncbi:DUF485 domain-containing protein [Bacillus velezensis]|uniref:DUF485 domain-containing protein n=1 Tax=Bacillus velezensis TaxID=492670 RepID=UPI000F8DF686|nr:DUF485 domain-containing protein [Bacillus velezensis]RUR98101.1 hypothetical protein EFW57_02475 [Bacillus velezensis]
MNQMNEMTDDLHRMMRERMRFNIPVSLFALAFALALPVFAFYTDVLSIRIAGTISLGWLFFFAQFVMTWLICFMYIKKARRFDSIAEAIRKRGEHS